MWKIFILHSKNLNLNVSRKSKYSNANILKALNFCDCRVPNQQLHPCKIFPYKFFLIFLKLKGKDLSQSLSFFLSFFLSESFVQGLELQGYIKRDSGTDVFLRISRRFWGDPFYRAPAENCFWKWIIFKIAVQHSIKLIAWSKSLKNIIEVNSILVKLQACSPQL